MLFLLTSTVAYGQGVFNKLHPDKIELENGQIIERLTFSTESDLDKFYEALCKDFGQAEEKNMSWIWNNISMPELSKEMANLKISMMFINGREIEWKKVSISVETLDKKTVLRPKTKSYKRIKKYLQKVINETIV